MIRWVKKWVIIYLMREIGRRGERITHLERENRELRLRLVLMRKRQRRVRVK